MTFDQVMYYGVWVWLFVAIAFAFFLLGRIFGYRQGYDDAKALYKVNWK